MNRPTKYLASLLLFLLLSGCGGYAVKGRVFAPDGRPVNNATVRLVTHPDSVEALSNTSTVTGGDGSFRIKTGFKGHAVLVVQGESGAGRVGFEAGKKGAPVAVVYPVAETIVILHDNDLHFDFNSLEVFRAKIADVRRKNATVFLFDAGDVVVRHRDRWVMDGQKMEDPGFYAKRAFFMIETMNGLGYNALTPGNHELSYIGRDTYSALAKACFPLLAANLKITGAVLPPVEPYHVFLTDTWRKVAVLGLAGGVSGSIENIELLDPYETAKTYLRLADENDVFVALTHIGYGNDKILAERCPEIDVIIGGHSHTQLETAETVNGVLIAQTGGSEHVMAKDHVKYLGEVVVTLKNGVIVDKHGKVTALPLP